MLLVVLTGALLAGAPLKAAFNARAYYDDKFYGGRPLFFVFAPVMGLRWDYLYGFAKNNALYPLAGFEGHLFLDNPARSDGVFFKLRLAAAGGHFVSETEARSGEFFLFRPSATGYLGYFWTLKRVVPFVERISPFVALGPGIETTFYKGRITRSVVGEQAIEAESLFPHAALQFGADLLLVRHLAGLRILSNTMFGVAMADTEEGFFSSTDLSLAFVMYLR